jgi:hypothetical protein
MAKRYAILWDTSGTQSSPVGFAIERDGDVLVNVPRQYGIPATFEAPYRVLLPDSTDVAYTPADEGYFDQVLLDLTRSFAIGERGEVDTCDMRTLLDLMTTKVTGPALEMRRGSYGSSRESYSEHLQGETRLVVAVSETSVYHVGTRHEVPSPVGQAAGIPYVAA